MTSSKPVRSRAAVKQAVTFATIAARTGFWLLCIHYFGADALLHLIAAWAFVSAVRDLTFARVRLGDIMDPAKRRRALAASIALEAVLTLIRFLAIRGLAELLSPYNATVGALVAGLALCSLFWARDTLIMSTRVLSVGRLSRYVRLASAVSGLAALFAMAELDYQAVTAAIAALVLREAVLFIGLIGLVAAAPILPRKTAASTQEADDEDEEEDDPSGAVDADGPAARSAFQDFLADNAVHARWRVVQVGTRALAQGLLGPFGSMATQFFFSFRKPAAYRPKERGNHAKAWLAGIALFGVILAILALADRLGLLQALGIVALGVGFRIVALGGNLLLWWQLNARLGPR